MEIAQQKAWSHLTDPEQMALTLVVVNDRSKKEAAIIMNIAPYKFTEIYLRARKFFVMFTKHYEIHDDLIPEYYRINKEFKTFIDQVVGYRLKPSDILKQEPMQGLLGKEAQLVMWGGFFFVEDTYFGRLAQEFDRWNNFRILPKIYQAPAAFPRRRNKTLKKIQQGLYAISDLGWDLLMQKYGTGDLPPMVFMPVVQS